MSRREEMKITGEVRDASGQQVLLVRANGETAYINGPALVAEVERLQREVAHLDAKASAAEYGIDAFWKDLASLRTAYDDLQQRCSDAVMARDTYLQEFQTHKDRAIAAEQDRDKWKGYFDSLSRSVKAEAESHKRTCAELAEKYGLKPPPDGRGARWGTDHDWFTITYRMGQRITDADAHATKLAAEVERLQRSLASEQERHANTQKYVERALGDERMAEATREMHESGNQSLPGIYVIAIKRLQEDAAIAHGAAEAECERAMRLEARALAAEQRIKELDNCPFDGNCSCAIWTRHDAAMALYESVGARKAAEQRVVELERERNEAVDMAQRFASAPDQNAVDVVDLRARLREVEAQRDEERARADDALNERSAYQADAYQAEQTAIVLRETLERVQQDIPAIAVNGSLAGPVSAYVQAALAAVQDKA